jgi:LemA protein
MKKTLIILAVIVVLIGWFVISTLNGLIPMDETCKANWSQVLNQYQRRSDLIPNLVATIKGYATH